MKYQINKYLPVAKFFYKGNHSHPVKRTVLIIKSNKKLLIGYELREGKKVRKFCDSPIKSYSKNKIAKGSNLRIDNIIRKNNPQDSTLIRKGLFDIIELGI